MFNIGSSEWPGLSKLIEECGEVIQIAGKIMAKPEGGQHWDGKGDLAERLGEELADLSAAMEFVLLYNRVPALTQRAERKFEQFTYWHEKTILGDKHRETPRLQEEGQKKA